MAEGTTRIPGVDTLADLIDRLCVEVHKLAWFENKKREEQAKVDKDPTYIATLDDKSRDCCELRSLLKSEINSLMEAILASGEYKAAREVRTFRPPGQRLADVMADRFHDIGQLSLRGEIASALQREIVG